MLFDDNGKGHYEYQIPDGEPHFQHEFYLFLYLMFRFEFLENIEDWPIDIIATDYKSYSIEWSCFPNDSGCKFLNC